MDGVDLLPSQRTRHRGHRAGPDRPRREHRLVGRVLVEVDEDALAPLLLPPGGGDEVRMAALQLPRHRYGRRPHLDRVPPRLQAQVHVQASVAGGLDEADQPELFEQRPHVVGHCLGHGEGRAGLRVEIDAQFVGMLEVRRADRPRVEAEAAEVHGPQQMSEVSHDEGARCGAVRRADDGGGQPVGPLLGHALLEEVRAPGAVREPLHQDRAVAHRLHERFLDGEVVVDQVHLRVLAVSEEDLVRARDGDLVARDGEDDGFSRHATTVGRDRRCYRCSHGGNPEDGGA